MTHLPIIVGMGGINSAGRTSGFHAYKRMVWDALSRADIINTWCDLANRMGISLGEEPSVEAIDAIKSGTLVRRITGFDPEKITYHQKAKLDPTGATTSFIIKKSGLPSPIPTGWSIEALGDHELKISVSEPTDILIPCVRQALVSSGGNIPTGFDPGKLYHARQHPRALQLAVYGASDALNSLGLEWTELIAHIRPDEVTVYAGSSLSPLDEHALGGLIGQPLVGGRISSRMLALSFTEMPADFINSYIINSLGTTGSNAGACASFLYNLRQGLLDIQAGRAKVAIVGNSEAPLVPEIVEGFRVMGALATDEQLRLLDEEGVLDNRRSCRPFSINAGFTLAESAQFLILMADTLALELGITIYGSVADVFINADANKKSIAEPGVGNYITVAKAVALARAILGTNGLQNTFVQAHGTGTPQNRQSESHILNETAKVFGIEKWPVAAIKSYVGHSLSSAAGDQIAATLGIWKYGWIPGIKTITHVAEDVHQSHLNILLDHHWAGEKGSKITAAIINSKGFGGNNATGVILSPQQTLKILKDKHGNNVIKRYRKKNKLLYEVSEAIDLKTCHGDERVIYKVGQCVMNQHSISLTQGEIRLSEFAQGIVLPSHNPYL